MSTEAIKGSRSGAQARRSLNARLEERRSEIEQATLTRVYAIADPIEAADPQYADGLRSAVSAALDYGLAAIEHGPKQAPPIPTSLIVQARLAARSGIDLDTVLRRYFAGYTLFGDFLLQEAEGKGRLNGTELKSLLRSQAIFFDRLVVAVSEEYGRETKNRPEGSEQRRTEHVRRLLDGELLDASTLNYELNAVHLGLVATGHGALKAIRALADTLDRRLLVVSRGEAVWAWLGGRRAVDPRDLARLLPTLRPPGVTLASGEPDKGLSGWRLTHQQAQAALPIAIRGGEPFVRYADVAFLASMLRDEVLATSIRQLYLAPLQRERDGGRAAKETLCAYFAAGRNVSSTAAALGVTRHTVSSRLRAIEEAIGRQIDCHAAEIETAIQLEGLAASNSVSGSLRN